jgi:hypothetical protein
MHGLGGHIRADHHYAHEHVRVDDQQLAKRLRCRRRRTGRGLAGGSGHGPRGDSSCGAVLYYLYM